MPVNEAGVVMISASEVPMIEADVVEHVRALRRAGWGVKRTARELGRSRHTVRKYRDETVPIGLQTRPAGVSSQHDGPFRRIAKVL